MALATKAVGVYGNPNTLTENYILGGTYLICIRHHYNLLRGSQVLINRRILPFNSIATIVAVGQNELSTMQGVCPGYSCMLRQTSGRPA